MISVVHPSPVGPLTLISDGKALVRLDFENPKYPGPKAPAGRDPILDSARRELDAFFNGRLKVFESPVAPRGTPFQERVWKALLTIPFGVTRTYGQIAAKIGNPTAFRAVGLANGRNPIAIIVPCHRVIGADGSLTGYGGGEDRKRLLLDLEQGALPLRC